MAIDNDDLIAEAQRWANGHPNRRSGELMEALVTRLLEAEQAFERHKRMEPKRAITKLREAEAVIEKVREIVEPPKPFELGKSMMRSFDRMIGDLRRTLATYKPTNQEGSDGA